MSTSSEDKSGGSQGRRAPFRAEYSYLPRVQQAAGYTNTPPRYRRLHK